MTIPYPAIRSAISPAVTDGYGPYNSAIKLIEGLFAGGQNGFWLPFTDFASLSQDSAGTLPYTALEQPVGRVLDKSRGLELGPEKAIVTGFTSAPVGGPSVSVYAAASLLTVGRTYLLSFTISDFVGSGDAGLDASSAGTQVRVSGNGSYTFRYSALANGAAFFSRDTNSYTCSGITFRELKGNHATQPTSTARGVVSARVNLLVKSEDFADASWVKGGGAFTGIKFTEDATAGAAHFVQQYNAAFAANSTISFKARLSSAGRDWCLLWDTVNNSRAWFNLATGVAGSTLGGATATITPAGVGAYDCEMVFTNPTAAINLRIALAPSDGTTFYDGDGVSGINIFRTSVNHISQSSLHYQRVNTTTDYDSVGFPKYLRLDGVDDFYTCGGGGSTTGFYYADVIRPMGGAGTRRVIWSDRSGNSGYELAINTSDKLELSAGNGTTITAVASTVSAALAEGKQYEVFDNGTVLSVQIDGSAPVTIARPVVTAGSSTITLYRGASTGYFNGQVIEPIYRAGPPPSAYERSVIRGYQMQKAGL